MPKKALTKFVLMVSILTLGITIPSVVVASEAEGTEQLIEDANIEETTTYEEIISDFPVPMLAEVPIQDNIILEEETVTEEVELPVVGPSSAIKITTAKLNIRKEASNSSEPIAILDRGSEVEVVAYDEQWAKIWYNEEYLYVNAMSLVDEEDWDEVASVPYSESVPLDYDLQAYLWNVCQQYGIKYCFALGTIELESQFNPNATHKNGNGTTDRGLCQVNSCWISDFKELGFIESKDDLYNPYICIDCGMYLLGEYVSMFGNCERAYATYNTGKTSVKSNKNSRAVMRNWEGWTELLGDI